MASGDSRRVWKLNAPAYGMNGAPVAFHRPLKRYLLNEGAPPLAVDLRIEVSKFDTCLFFVFRRNFLAVGVTTTHTDDLLNKIEKFLSTRSGPVELREDNFAHVGMDVFRKNDGPVEITHGDPYRFGAPHYQIAAPLEGSEPTTS